VAQQPEGLLAVLPVAATAVAMAAIIVVATAVTTVVVTAARKPQTQGFSARFPLMTRL
jgi:uncharacterized membrane protein